LKPDATHEAPTGTPTTTDATGESLAKKVAIQGTTEAEFVRVRDRNAQLAWTAAFAASKAVDETTAKNEGEGDLPKVTSGKKANQARIAAGLEEYTSGPTMSGADRTGERSCAQAARGSLQHGSAKGHTQETSEAETALLAAARGS
jgi:hypothetical protein